jgi:hypothetical protein
VSAVYARVLHRFLCVYPHALHPCVCVCVSRLLVRSFRLKPVSHLVPKVFALAVILHAHRTLEQERLRQGVHARALCGALGDGGDLGEVADLKLCASGSGCSFWCGSHGAPGSPHINCGPPARRALCVRGTAALGCLPPPLPPPHTPTHTPPPVHCDPCAADRSAHGLMRCALFRAASALVSGCLCKRCVCGVCVGCPRGGGVPSVPGRPRQPERL